MVSYYLLIEADGMAVPTHVYHVPVGTSKQANRDYLAITAHCVDRGYFWQMFSAEIRDFELRILSTYNIIPQVISARDYVRNLKAATASPFPQYVLDNIMQHRTATSLSYRVSSAIHRITPATGTRQNLSHKS